MEETCLICLEDITDPQYVECFICGINLHNGCEQTYRLHNNHNYCKCIHCQRIGTLFGQEKNVDYLQVNAVMDPAQYTMLDHTKNNENVFATLVPGTTVYYVEKYFTSNRKEWRAIDCIIITNNTINKEITTKHPDKNGLMYTGGIYYEFGHPLNLVDYYVKNENLPQ